VLEKWVMRAALSTKRHHHKVVGVDLGRLSYFISPPVDQLPGHRENQKESRNRINHPCGRLIRGNDFKDRRKKKKLCR